MLNEKERGIREGGKGELNIVTFALYEILYYFALGVLLLPILNYI